MQLIKSSILKPDQLFCKTKPLPKYPFVHRAKYGSILFVGEGNLSFSLAVALQCNGVAKKIISTVYEKSGEIYKETMQNAHSLNRMGVSVLCNIDATKLHEEFFGITFDTICFQFPNIGSRQPKYGRNPNHDLLVKFLRSSKQILSNHGEVVLTIVNRPHYDGAFAIENAAEKARYQSPEEYLFRSKDFPGYRHTNTLHDTSAIAKYRSFRTYCFKPRN